MHGPHTPVDGDGSACLVWANTYKAQLQSIFLRGVAGALHVGRRGHTGRLGVRGQHLGPGAPKLRHPAGALGRAHRRDPAAAGAAGGERYL